jgi:hypothetical protein
MMIIIIPDALRNVNSTSAEDPLDEIKFMEISLLFKIMFVSRFTKYPEETI